MNDGLERKSTKHGLILLMSLKGLYGTWYRPGWPSVVLWVKQLALDMRVKRHHADASGWM